MSTTGTSRSIGAPPEQVWDCIGDFGRWDRWLPRIRHSELQGGTGRAPVGAVRALTLDDGTRVGERLVAADERRRMLVYSFAEDPPFAVSHYEATVEVHSVAQGASSVVTWTGEFDANSDSVAALSATFAGIYEGFLDALAAYLA